MEKNSCGTTTTSTSSSSGGSARNAGIRTTGASSTQPAASSSDSSTTAPSLPRDASLHVKTDGNAATAAVASTATTGATAPVAQAMEAPRASKHTLVDCRIGGHTIEKCASPKKKALDPMRYMPDRATFYALFTVHVRFEDATTDRQVYRTYKQLSALHSRLQKKYPKSNVPRDLPTMRKKRYDNEYIEQKKHELNQYLKQLLELPEIKQSKTLREFLEDSRLSDDSEDEEVNPSAKMLEGLPGTIVTVRAGQSFSVSLNLPNVGDVVSWQFTTKKHNIGFSATFNGDTIRVYSREDSQHKPIKGFYKCTVPGVCTLNWDNTYTWSKGKVLVYWAEVEQTRCTASSPVGTIPGGPDLGSALPNNDGRRSGYIEKNRNHALYPRRIMNSSISMITKPFVSGKQSQPQQYKAGSLIVERNIKFRGRNWYRKWFVLDTRKCILRYYDSESAARRGLSISKLNLNHKNASLAITSGEEAAPTPYMFIARTRKRCWKICASSLTEYNEWEHAISTAILTAQLSKRRRSGSDDTAEGKKLAGSPGCSQKSQATGNPLLHEDRADGLDESEESEEDEDEDDRGKEEDDGDSDGDQSASDGDIGQEDQEPVMKGQRRDVHKSDDRRMCYGSPSPAAPYVDLVGAWELKWKILLVVVVNVALLCIRFLPMEIVGGGLLLSNGGMVALKLLHARRDAEEKKQS